MHQAIKNVLRPIYRRVRQIIEGAPEVDVESFNQQAQRTIVNQYKLFKSQGVTPYAKIKDAGFRVYSQADEDGIILYVLSMIGFKSRRVVEICCGSGDVCMATNLILNHSFDGYLFDGDPDNIRRATKFFESKRDCLLHLPMIKQAWITKDNVNELLIENGCTGEVDLLSLDIDGNDYWIWDAISAINPRLCVFETHNIIPSDKALTIPYRADFSTAEGEEASHDYLGTSLLAMQKLGKKRGYRLIGGHAHGFNVFFLREDEGTQFFPEVSVEEVHDNRWTKLAQAQRWPLVKDMPWKEV